MLRKPGGDREMVDILALVPLRKLEQNDTRAVQRGRYRSLEARAPLSDDPNIMLSAVPAA